MNWGGDMALLQCSFKSEVLEMEQPLHVILPQIKMLEEERREQIKKNGFRFYTCFMDCRMTTQSGPE